MPGPPLGSSPNLISPEVFHPAALALGLGTAGAIWLLARRWPALPAPLLALVAGTAAHALWAALASSPAVGATVGELPSTWPCSPALLPLWSTTGAALLQDHAWKADVTALALASIGALETSLKVRAIDQRLGTRHDANRELVALGCANMVCGLLGGVPLAATRTRAIAT